MVKTTNNNSSRGVSLPNDGERMVPELHRQTMAYGDHIARYESAMPFVDGKVVLDIASGSGYGSKMLSRKAKKVYGVDINTDAVKYAQENYSADNIEFIQGSGTAIPLKDDSVDAVVTFETLEHIEEAEQFIKEIKRVLRKDGVLVLSTPNDVEFPEGNHFHVHEFEYEELRDILKKYFKNADSYYQATWIYTAIADADTILNQNDAEIRTIQVAPIERDKALFFMWVCSDERITDKVKSLGVIAEHWSAKQRDIHDKKVEAYIKKTIRHYEKIVKAKDTQIASLNKDMSELQDEIQHINNSSLMERIKRLKG